MSKLSPTKTSDTDAGKACGLEDVIENVGELYIVQSRIETFVGLCDTILDESAIAGTHTHIQVVNLLEAACAEIKSQKGIIERVDGIAHSLAAGKVAA